MALMQEITGSNVLSREFLVTLGTLAGLGATAVKSFVRVPQNHRGLKTYREDPFYKRGERGNKKQLRGSVGPGIHPVIPFFGGIKSESMQERPTDLRARTVETPEGKHVYDAAARWHIEQNGDEYWDLVRLYSALFRVQDEKLDNFMMQVTEAGASLAISGMTRAEAMQPKAVFDKVKEQYGVELSEYGIALDSLYILAMSRSEAQTHADELRKSPFDPDTASRLAALSAPITPGLRSVDEQAS